MIQSALERYVNYIASRCWLPLLSAIRPLTSILPSSFSSFLFQSFSFSFSLPSPSSLCHSDISSSHPLSFSPDLYSFQCKTRGAVKKIWVHRVWSRLSLLWQLLSSLSSLQIAVHFSASVSVCVCIEYRLDYHSSGGSTASISRSLDWVEAERTEKDGISTDGCQIRQGRRGYSDQMVAGLSQDELRRKGQGTGSVRRIHFECVDEAEADRSQCIIHQPDLHQGCSPRLPHQEIRFDLFSGSLTCSASILQVEAYNFERIHHNLLFREAQRIVHTTPVYKPSVHNWYNSNYSVARYNVNFTKKNFLQPISDFHKF